MISCGIILMKYLRNNCTYCGGDIEDNFSRCGLASAILLFPIGNLSLWPKILNSENL